MKNTGFVYFKNSTNNSKKVSTLAKNITISVCKQFKDFKGASMNSWSDIYFLKEAASVSDVWSCIRVLFPDDNLPQHVPSHFSFETDCCAFLWHNPQDSAELVEFRFTKNVDNQRNSLKILFSKAINNKQRDKVHVLFYEETAETIDLIFCHKFFSELRQFVPKQYISSRMLDDKNFINQFISERKKKEIEEFAFDLRDYDEIRENFIKNRLKTTDSPIIRFCADKNNEFFFPNEWIEKVSKDLWFLNVQIIKHYNIIAEFNQNFFDTFEGQIVKDVYPDKNCKTSEIIKGVTIRHFSDDNKRLFKEHVSKYIDPDSIICIQSFLESKLENTLTPDENDSFSSDSDYTVFKNELISFIDDYKQIVDKKIQEYMPELLKMNDIADYIADEKTTLLLKELGLDKSSLEDLRRERDAVLKENTQLKNEITSWKNEFQRIEQINKNLLAGQNKVFSQSVEKKSDIETQLLFQEIEALELEKKLLQDKNIALNSRIKQLESKNTCVSKELNCYVLKIPCSKKELFADEISDYLYQCLYTKIAEDEKKLPADKESEVTRKRDVIKALINEQIFSFECSETNLKLDRIEKILKDSNKPELQELKHEGFEVIENNNHTKVYFYDKRYQITFSLTPSDKKVSYNKMNEIEGRFFLV